VDKTEGQIQFNGHEWQVVHHGQWVTVIPATQDNYEIKVDFND